MLAEISVLLVSPLKSLQKLHNVTSALKSDGSLTPRRPGMTFVGAFFSIIIKNKTTSHSSKVTCSD